MNITYLKDELSKSAIKITQSINNSLLAIKKHLI